MIPDTERGSAATGAGYQESRHLADDVTIPLDRLHRAIRSADRWAVQRFQPDGSWDMIEAWDGGRRSLLQWCAKNKVHPTREAEQMLDNLSEGTRFRER